MKGHIARKMELISCLVFGYLRVEACFAVRQTDARKLYPRKQAAAKLVDIIVLQMEPVC
ncbi:hypothetical protein D3C74_466670 [compost metagenome]